MKKKVGRKRAVRKWSGRVTRASHAITLDEGVFTWKNPRKIARSLLRSATASQTRKSTPFRSAMSMLVFYINRAGKPLDATQHRVLEQAKVELRKLQVGAETAANEGK